MTIVDLEIFNSVIFDMMYHDVKKDAKKYGKKDAKKDGHNQNDIFSSCISLCYDIFSSFLSVILVFLCDKNWVILFHILPYYTNCTISCHNVSIYMLYNLFHNLSTIYQCKIILSLSVQHYSYSPSAELVFQRLQTRVQVDTRN